MQLTSCQTFKFLKKSDPDVWNFFTVSINIFFFIIDIAGFSSVKLFETWDIRPIWEKANPDNIFEEKMVTYT